MDWQPIETAPKDGSPMLLWCPGGIERQNEVEGLCANTAVGFWLEGGWKSVECEDRGSMGSTLTGWMESIEWITVTPSHWMPLPEPPTVRRAARGCRVS